MVFLVTLLMAWSNLGPGYAAAAVAVLVVSALLVRRTCQPFSPTRATIPGFWYATYFLLILWPSFYVCTQHQGPYWPSFLFAVLSVLVTVPLGWELANFASYYKPAEGEAFFRAPLVSGMTIRSSVIFFCIFGFALLMTGIYLMEVRVVPLFYLLTKPSDWLTLAVLREESFKLLNSPFVYIFSLIKGVIYPFLIMVAFGFYLVGRERKWLWRFAAVLGGGLFFASLTLAKSPVATIFLMLGLFYYFYHQGRPSRRAIASFLVLVLLFPVLVVTAIVSRTNLKLKDVADIFVGIGDRLFHVPAETLYYYFRFFPKAMPYLHGRSISTFSSLLGFEHVNTPNVVGQYVNPLGLTSVSANAAFIGDMHADFGVWGVLLGGVMAGLVMQMFHIYLVRRRKTVTTLAAYAFLVVMVWLLHSSALPQLLASNGGLLVFLLAWVFDMPVKAATGTGRSLPSRAVQAPGGIQ